MTLLRTFVLALGLLVATPSRADDARQQAASELLDAMDMEASFERLIDASLEAQLSQKPELEPYRAVFRAFFAKHMSYPQVRPKLAAVYAGEFTVDELVEARAFYAGATGRKFVQRMPELFAKGAQVGQAAVQAHLPELVTMIQAEQARRASPAAASGTD